jgi:hypothetical protein
MRLHRCGNMPSRSMTYPTSDASPRHVAVVASAPPDRLTIVQTSPIRRRALSHAQPGGLNAASLIPSAYVACWRTCGWSADRRLRRDGLLPLRNCAARC